jgi:hypothetical protein
MILIKPLIQWSLTFLALSLLVLANKAVITPSLLNEKYEKKNRKIMKEKENHILFS